MDTEDNVDLYEDLDRLFCSTQRVSECNLSYAELQKTLKEKEAQISALRLQVKQMAEQNASLKKNISCLFRTAKKELACKNEQINMLHTTFLERRGKKKKKKLTNTASVNLLSVKPVLVNNNEPGSVAIQEGLSGAEVSSPLCVTRLNVVLSNNQEDSTFSTAVSGAGTMLTDVCTMRDSGKATSESAVIEQNKVSVIVENIGATRTDSVAEVTMPSELLSANEKKHERSFGRDVSAGTMSPGVRDNSDATSECAVVEENELSVVIESDEEVHRCSAIENSELLIIQDDKATSPVTSISNDVVVNDNSPKSLSAEMCEQLDEANSDIAIISEGEIISDSEGEVLSTSGSHDNCSGSNIVHSDEKLSSCDCIDKGRQHDQTIQYNSRRHSEPSSSKYHSNPSSVARQHSSQTDKHTTPHDISRAKRRSSGDYSKTFHLSSSRSSRTSYHGSHNSLRSRHISSGSHDPLRTHRSLSGSHDPSRTSHHSSRGSHNSLRTSCRVSSGSHDSSKTLHHSSSGSHDPSRSSHHNSSVSHDYSRRLHHSLSCVSQSHDASNILHSRSCESHQNASQSEKRSGYHSSVRTVHKRRYSDRGSSKDIAAKRNRM